MQSVRRLLITRSSLEGIGMYTRSQSKQSESGKASTFVLTHDAAKQKFHMKVNSSGTALVSYKKTGNVLDLVHSYVPDSMRGKRIGHILAKQTFDYIDQNKLQMKLTCPFLLKIYEENKNQYKHLISEK